MYEQLTNGILLQYTGRKDINAFNELYYRFAEELLNTAFRKTNDRQIAADLVQDLFIWLWEKAGNIPEKSLNAFDVRAYLQTALRNKIYNHYYQQTRSQAIVVEYSKSFMQAEAHSGQTLDYKDLQSAIHAGIEDLPPKMQEIFKLSRQQDLGIREIAGVLQLSEQTVKNQLSKATSRLRSSLNGDLASCITLMLTLLLL